MIGNKLKFKKGFTLVELLVAAVTFSIVFSGVMGALASSIKYQKYNLAHHRLIGEASYAMEYMARVLRMAQLGEGGGSCPDGHAYNVLANGKMVAFVDYNGFCRRFYWDEDINQLITEGDFGSAALTSDDFEIINLLFSVKGDVLGDNLQPSVTVLMELREKKLPDKPIIVLQTTVSQRNLDM
ncbi:MAG: type II secretion system protein [bacterium]|nr:type II secretion system protein [bacterium]